MSEVKTVYGGYAPMGQEATVQEPPHLKPVRSLLVPELPIDGEELPITPATDRGIHKDQCLRICEALVAGGFTPVEQHPRPYFWTRPGDPQMYSRGWAYQLMQEEKAK